MTYLDELYLCNFQSHRESLLKLDRGVNVIYGQSGAGKTAILRALRLLIYNRPSGAKYYANFAKDEGETHIYAHFSDDTTIHLTKHVKRGKKDRKKALTDTVYEVEGTEYRPGKDVPDVIRQYLNIGQVNIQKQFDGPFLIFSSPGEIAKTINAITQLEEADGWKADLTKRINRKKQEVEILNDHARAVEQELAQYQGIEDLTAKIADLEVIDGKVEVLMARSFALDQGLQKIEKIEKDIQALTPMQDIIQEKITALEDVETRYAAVNDLRQAVRKLIDVEEGLEKRRAALAKFERLALILDIFDERQRLQAAITEIERLDGDMISLGVKFNEKKDQYISVITKDKKCPICFTDIDKKTIDRISKEL